MAAFGLGPVTSMDYTPSFGFRPSSAKCQGSFRKSSARPNLKPKPRQKLRETAANTRLDDMDGFILNDEDDTSSAIDALGDVLLKSDLDQTTQVFRPSSATNMRISRTLSAPSSRLKQRTMPHKTLQSAQSTRPTHIIPSRQLINSQAELPRKEYAPAPRKRVGRKRSKLAKKQRASVAKATALQIGSFQLLRLPRAVMVRIIEMLCSRTNLAGSCTAARSLTLQIFLQHIRQDLVYAVDQYERAVCVELRGCKQQVDEQQQRHTALEEQVSSLRIGQCGNTLNTRSTRSEYVWGESTSVVGLRDIIADLGPDDLAMLQLAPTPVPITLRLTMKLMCILFDHRIPETAQPKPKPKPKRASTAKGSINRTSRPASSTRISRGAEWTAGLELVSQGLLAKIAEYNVARLTPVRLEKALRVIRQLEASAQDKAYCKRVEKSYGKVTEVARVLVEWASELCKCRVNIRGSLLDLLTAKADVEDLNSKIDLARQVFQNSCSSAEGEWIKDGLDFNTVE